MNRVKIGVAGAGNNIDCVKSLLKISDQDLPNIELFYSEDCPDIIMATEQIYTSQKALKKFKLLLSRAPNAVTLFRTGECVSPDFNLFDYAISFDRFLSNSDRFIRIPYSRYFRDSLFIEQKSINYENKIKSGNVKFCNFIYSNPIAHKMRDDLFYILNEYKKVDSMGKHLNNVGNAPTRNDIDWRLKSIRMREQYKFSIAAENACFDGYISEKIICSLQAGSIPIYFGDRNIKNDFNHECFVDASDFRSLDELLEYVIQIDKDDNLWLKIATSPWRTEEQYKAECIHDKNYLLYINNLLTQRVKHVGTGTFPDIYHSWFFRNESIIDKVDVLKRKIQYRLK